MWLRISSTGTVSTTGTNSSNSSSTPTLDEALKCQDNTNPNVVVKQPDAQWVAGSHGWKPEKCEVDFVDGNDMKFGVIVDLFVSA